MWRPSPSIASRPRVIINGYELVEDWIEPDPWSWVYRQPRTRRT